MFHSGLIVRQQDPILRFILVIIDTKTPTHSYVLKTARPNFMFHSGGYTEIKTLFWPIFETIIAKKQ